MGTLDAANGAPNQPAEETGAVQQLKDFLRPFISRIRSSVPNRAAAPSWRQSLDILRHHGLSPATVFDIGVAYGTYELYRAFPDAYYHLIDPTRESLHHMRQLARRLRERAVVRETPPDSGHYYLDVEVWRALRRTRRRVLAAVLIVAVAASLASYFGALR